MVIVKELLVLCIVLHLGWTVTLMRAPSLDPQSMCSVIKFQDPKRHTAIRESVLRQLCQVGVSHVDLDSTQKQFAIYNLHRDSFDSQPKWHSGDAKNVVADKYWAVNDVNEMDATKHHWYTHGLPMWPLPHQALPNMTIQKPVFPLPKVLLPLNKKKPVDWPNYGMATPIYFAAKAWRNQAWSVEEFFQEMKKKKKSPFQDQKKFHKLAKSLVESIDGQQVENYSEWPFLKYSLVPMVKSMFIRNKGLCPDELYIYLRMTPCHPKEARHLFCTQAAMTARILLTEANCRTTDVIVGYTQEYDNDAL